MPIPEFIVELRRHIGQSLLWLPGVTAVVLRGEEVLLVRRADNGRWAPVTGIVDPGERPADTAVREALEETGVHCAVERLARVGVGAPVTHVNGDRAQYLDHTFRCRHLDGEPRVADDESVEVGYFPLETLPPMQDEHIARIGAALRGDPATELA